MPKFTGTITYSIKIENNFEIYADNLAEAIEKIKNDPLKYDTNLVSGFDRDSKAIIIQLERVNN